MTRISTFFALVLLLGASAFSTASAVEKTEIQITDTKIGEGRVAGVDHRVQVHYTGWDMDGKKFDTSRDGDAPFRFTIGMNEVIKGWDIGVRGMREGGKRELLVPAEFAYGEHGYPGYIAPNADLKFEIELLKIENHPLTWLRNKKNNDELDAALASGMPVIDIRSLAELKEKGVIIAGSHHIPALAKHGVILKTFFPALKKVVQKNDAFMLICSNGKKAIYLGQIMSNLKGYSKLHAVQKGIDKYIEHGGAVVQYDGKTQDETKTK